MTEFQPFRLDSDNQCLWRGTERLTLTPKAFFMLKYLVERAGRLVTHGELLEALWPGTFVQPEVLKSHILDIRHVLGDDAKEPKFIETQHRRGYRFIAELQDGAKIQKPDLHPAASIAVLPFTNLGGDHESEYFGDGLAEDIINQLTKIAGLKVIARTSAFAFKGGTHDIRRIGEALGVGRVLEGSVRIAGNLVRVTGQLIDASDGSHLWSGRYDRDLSDLFGIQDEIARAIADALETQLRGTGEKRPARPEAYRAYLEGRYHVQQATPKGMERGLECFERAIRLDPGYALPHSGLALQAYFRVLYLASRPRDLVPAAFSSLETAMRLDPGSAEAHVVRGVFSSFFEYDWKAAERHFAMAREMDPASATARLSLAVWFLLPTMRLPEALDEITRAATIDPLSPAVRSAELWILYTMRKMESLDRARKLVQLFPSLPICSFTAALTFMRWDRIDESVTTLEEGLKIAPSDVFLLGVLALARARQGRLSEVREIRAGLEKRAKSQYIPFLSLSYCAEACGDVEIAYELLDQAIEEREPLAVLVLADRRADPRLDARCQSLLRKMNLA